MLYKDDSAFEVLDHPHIGRVRGVKTQAHINQFLGIQYATLDDGFSRGKQVVYPSRQHLNGELDATEQGPTPINVHGRCAGEQRVIQRALPARELRQSDVDCLTLNISAPSKLWQLGGNFPVLFFLYGGDFAGGSSCYPHYDLARITGLGIANDTPIVAVGANYRTGVPGFLHSKELAAAGYLPNNGLDDQRLALRWVQNHIAGFGGCPGRITLVGQSAGAASGCFHLEGAEPLFQQFVAMGGSSMLHPRSLSQLQVAYCELMSDLGAHDASSEAQVQRLLEAAREGYLATLSPNRFIGPILDGKLLPRKTPYQSLTNVGEAVKSFPGMSYCMRVLVGDCQMDGSMWQRRFPETIEPLVKTFIARLHDLLEPIDPEILPKISYAYGLASTDRLEEDHLRKSMLTLGNDLGFACPVIALADAWSQSSDFETEAFLYHFNCPNPWDGPWKGHANHVLDIAFALQNYHADLEPGQRQTAERFAKDIIAFVHGLSPWSRYKSDEKQSMTYYAPMDGSEDRSEFVPIEKSEMSTRRSLLYSLAHSGVLDKVTEVWREVILCWC